MRILFLTHYFPPEVNAPATRTYEHCKEWVKKGAEVTVITCFPNFPQGIVFNGYKNKWKKIEYIDGIKVIRVWSYIAANEGFFKRILDYMSFSFISFFHLLFSKNRYSIIIATSPQFFTGLTAMIFSKIKKIPWIFEVRDLWPEGIIVLKHSSLLYKILERLEYRYYKTSSGIVTVTNSFKVDIQNRFGIPDKKFAVIYNGANRTLFNLEPKSKRLIEKIGGGNNKFIIGYAGTLGISHSLDFILDAANEIEKDEPNIIFLFIGSGAMESYMKNFLKENNLSNVIILPSVKKEDIPEYIAVFDVGLVPLKKNEAYRKVIPSKIFELAAMQKPILLGVEGESKSIINKYKAGYTYIPEDRSSFIDSIKYLYYNRSEIKKYTEGLKKLSYDFDRKIQANNMINFIKQKANENNYK